jgi:hypothetical protein
MSGLVALVTKLLISMTLLLLWYEYLHDGVKIDASLVKQPAIALASSLVLRTIFMFVRTRFLASMSAISCLRAAISTNVPLTLTVTTTSTVAINVVMSTINAANMWIVDHQTAEKFL